MENNKVITKAKIALVFVNGGINMGIKITNLPNLLT